MEVTEELENLHRNHVALSTMYKHLEKEHLLELERTRAEVPDSTHLKDKKEPKSVVERHQAQDPLSIGSSHAEKLAEIDKDHLLKLEAKRAKKQETLDQHRRDLQAAQAAYKEETKKLKSDVERLRSEDGVSMESSNAAKAAKAVEKHQQEIVSKGQAKISSMNRLNCVSDLMSDFKIQDVLFSLYTSFCSRLNSCQA